MLLRELRAQNGLALAKVKQFLRTPPGDHMPLHHPALPNTHRHAKTALGTDRSAPAPLAHCVHHVGQQHSISPCTALCSAPPRLCLSTSCLHWYEIGERGLAHPPGWHCTPPATSEHSLLGLHLYLSITQLLLFPPYVPGPILSPAALGLFWRCRGTSAGQGAFLVQQTWPSLSRPELRSPTGCS